jgi:DNA polymerase-4
MERLGIRKGADLKAQSSFFLERQFGKAGPYYFGLARGIDLRPVCANRIRKSIGAENTFSADLFTLDEARAALKALVAKVWAYCEESTVRGRTVTLKAKFADFQQVTRSRTGPPFTTEAAVEAVAYVLLESLFPVSKGIRLLGVALSSLGDDTKNAQQLRLSL